MTDFYPIFKSIPHPDSSGYMPSLQASLDYYLVWQIQTCILASKELNYSTPFWLTVQTHNAKSTNESEVGREPSIYEIRVQVNLGVCYGAKGISYYNFAHCNYVPNDDLLGILNPDGSKRMAYGESKFDEIKSINTRLNTLGPTLMQLNWRDAFSRHKLGQTFNKFSMLSGGSSITNIFNG